MMPLLDERLYRARADQTVNCSVWTVGGETLCSAENFPVYLFHYLELRFGEDPEFRTI